jgi:succinyl-diaminopimelate desuccinylase
MQNTRDPGTLAALRNDARAPNWSLVAAQSVPNIVDRGAMSKRSRNSAADAGELRSWVQQRQKEMSGLLAELVAIPTENPPGTNLRACADLLATRLRDAGLTCEYLQPNGRGEIRADHASDSSGSRDEAAAIPVSLLAEYGRGGRALYFHGHYDVVPAQSPEQFQPIRKEHFLFGRGSCDMKGGIVAMLYAICALKECSAELDGRIGLLLVPDEETGGAQGSARLAQHGLLGRDGIGMLTAEPTSGTVWNANRGAITLRVDVFGKSAHVGLQHHGENAFERMHRAVEQLLRLKREVEQRKTSCNIGAGQSANSILLIGGQSAGGANFNVVPDQCWFTVDRRINPEENLREEKARLLDVLEQCKRDGIPLAWEILQEGGSTASRDDETLAQNLARSVETITGKAPRFEMCPGLLETRFYAAQRIPAYAYGPGLLSVAHGPNEYIDLRRMTECAAIYALTVMEFLNA